MRVGDAVVQGKFGFTFLHQLRLLYKSWRETNSSGDSEDCDDAAEWPSVRYIMTGVVSRSVCGSQVTSPNSRICVCCCARQTMRHPTFPFCGNTRACSHWLPPAFWTFPSMTPTALRRWVACVAVMRGQVCVVVRT